MARVAFVRGRAKGGGSDGRGLLAGRGAEPRHIPVIMLTGIAHEFKRFIGTRRQTPVPAGYFDKPADLNKILEKIEEILSSRPVQ